MGERWRIEVELTFDPVEGETNTLALYRVKDSLNRFLEHESEVIAHYHILKMPEICVEFD